MLRIRTIAEFLNLPQDVQFEIQRSIGTKERLETWLLSRNKKKGQIHKDEKFWAECHHCDKEQRGWIWKDYSRDNNDIHPSQMNKCIKFIWFSCNNYAEQLEERIDPRTRLIFDLGSAWHDTVQDYGKRGAWCSPKDYEAEVRMSPDVDVNSNPINPIAHKYWIRGSADALIDDYRIENVPGIGEVSLRLIHEYKTINSANYSKLVRPKIEHKRQATVYSMCLDVPIVVYLYMNKDNCQLIDYPVPFDSTIQAEIIDKIEKVQQYTESKQMPPWEITSAILNPKECMECGFRSICNPPIMKRP